MMSMNVLCNFYKCVKSVLLSREITIEQIITTFFLFTCTCSCESAGEFACVFHVCPSAWKYSAPTQWISVPFCTWGLIISFEIFEVRQHHFSYKI